LAVELVQANDFLTRLREELTQSISSEPFFAPLLKQSLAQRLEPIKFRREIECALGYPLNHWGKLRRSQEATLRQQILSQLNPICLEIYAHCYIEIIDMKLHDSQLKSIDKIPNVLDSTSFLNGSRPQETLSTSSNQNILRESENREEFVKDKVKDKSENSLNDSIHPLFVTDETFE
jgi:hypothetical protein